VRDHFLADHHECAACGARGWLQVHHVRPFHLDPSLELVTENLVTLCMTAERCHLDLGHGGDFDAFNPHVLDDAREFRLDRAARERVRVEAKARSHRLF